MQRWLVGLVPFRDLLRNGHARVVGAGSRLARAFPTWFDMSYFSAGPLLFVTCCRGPSERVG